MGENESRGQQPENGLLPNGLLVDDSASVIQPLEPDRWFIAEQRTAELIKFIKPNKPSEELRTAVASYVRRLIMNCFPCQVFTFGSVPLKTYLPDGDIDLTTFSNNEMKETWAHQVRDTLENEEKNENAEFRVKEVQYIQAEVKIIKCLVENIVVDISFNQLGGLCTLCFLEEVDNLISQDHLFKRSIILIKAWCYYESRILGAHHGLISTYALETLVLYIFHVFNNSFTGPLEVLYRFLEFFSKFDWDNFCISLWGPVPIRSLPDVAAEPPRKDGGELLLSKPFLEACSAVYAVFPSGQENQSQPFVSKYFNVIDPLRVNNNLGRSVSKGNFFRIRSAFAFGAKKLARLLDCPKEDIQSEVSQFFMNTWDRHGDCQRPDVPRTGLVLPIIQNAGQISGYEMGGYVSATRLSSPQNSDIVLDQRNSGETSDSKAEEAVEKGTRKTKEHSGFDMGRYLFVRTRSSPELTDNCPDSSSQSRRGKGSDSKKHQAASARSSSTQKRSPENEIVSNHSSRSSTEDRTSRHDSLPQCFDGACEATSVSKDIHAAPSGADGEELFSSLRTHEMNQDEQDMINMMAASTSVGFCTQFHAPINMPFSFSPILASMGCNQTNMAVLPPNMNIPVIDHWGSNPQLAPYFSGLELTSNPDDSPSSVPVDGDRNDWEDRSGSASHPPSLVAFPNPRNVQRTKRDEPEERSSASAHGVSRDESESSRNNGRIPADASRMAMPREKKGKRQEKSNASSANEAVIPLAPMILGHGSHPRTSDNVPLTFYPTGPPVPFVTMLPFYNFRNEQESAGDGPEHTPDILNSDFASHWQNLQYGRLCQSSRHPSPLIYQSPVYLQGRYSSEAPGRPNPNVFSQIMTYGNHVLPVAPLHSLPNIHKNHFDDLPRYRAGTGTYLPSPGRGRGQGPGQGPGPGPGPAPAPAPKAPHRHGHGHNRKGIYYERSEQANEREGKYRASSRSMNRSQTSSTYGRNGAECAPPMVMYYPSADHLDLGTFGYLPFHNNLPDDHPPP